MQRQVFTRCGPTLQRAATSRLVTVRAMASQAHNPGAITKKVFFDMEVGGNKAGAQQPGQTRAGVQLLAAAHCCTHQERLVCSALVTAGRMRVCAAEARNIIPRGLWH